MKIINIFFLLVLGILAALFVVLIKTGNRALQDRDSNPDYRLKNIYYPYEKYFRPIGLVGMVCVLGIVLNPAIVGTQYSPDETPHIADGGEDTNDRQDTADDVHKEISENRPIVVLPDSVHELLASITMTAYAADVREDVDSKTIQIQSTDGDEYTVDEVGDRPLLIPYKEDGYEVFFLGHINEKGHWDGKCLLNSYLDRKLVFANSVEYADGVEMNFEQYYVDDDGLSFIDKKAVSAKEIYGQDTDSNGNQYVYQGSTWTYRVFDPVEQCISMESPTSEQLYTLESLRKSNYSQPYKYYNGLSSAYVSSSGDRKVGANDSLGISDYVEFYEDGTVRMAYHGKFKDTKPDDREGGSWEIVCDQDRGIGYRYNFGLFQSGRYDVTASKTAGYTKENLDALTMDQISMIIKGTSFEKLDLKWEQELLGD